MNNSWNFRPGIFPVTLSITGAKRKRPRQPEQQAELLQRKESFQRHDANPPPLKQYFFVGIDHTQQKPYSDDDESSGGDEASLNCHVR